MKTRILSLISIEKNSFCFRIFRFFRVFPDRPIAESILREFYQQARPILRIGPLLGSDPLEKDTPATAAVLCRAIAIAWTRPRHWRPARIALEQ